MTLSPAAPVSIPIMRCPRCGARWVLRRVSHADEHGEPLYCLACGEEYVLEGGIPIAITRPASTLTDADLRRERHAQAVQATGEGR